MGTAAEPVQSLRDVVGSEFGEAVGAGRAGKGSRWRDRDRGQTVERSGLWARVQPTPRVAGAPLPRPGRHQPGGDDRNRSARQGFSVVGGESNRLTERRP